MKARIVLAVMLVIVFLVATGTASAAGGTGKVTGGIQFFAPQWGNLTIWQQYSVHQTDPDTHAATGHVNWKIYSPIEGWRSIDALATCLAITEELDGSKTAVVVSRIVSKRGWGAGDPGEYARFWVRDGGTPGSAGDQWSNQSYDPFPEPWYEFWPADGPAPDCESFVPDAPPFDLTAGNLVIH